MTCFERKQMKVGFLTLGCRVNQYESQALSEELEKMGFEIAKFGDKCDVYVVNTCAVTEESVRKSRQMVRRAIKRNPEAFVAVTGCAAQLDPDAFSGIENVGYVCGTRNKKSIIDAVSMWMNGKSDVLSKEKISSLTEPMERLNITHFERTRAYVKIQDGCNNKCAYCIIPSLRGGIVSRPVNEILEEAEALAGNGCHEIVLTGIETASYEYGLADLIEKISEVNGIDRIRMGSLEPSFVRRDLVDRICEIPKMEHHFHLSVQSGCDEVLHAMRRKYNTAMLSERIEYIRSKMPDVMFSADVIVGFPGETDEMFQKTCEFLKKAGFLHLHIFTYSKRPGTEAAMMQGQVDECVKNERLHILSEIAHNEKLKIYNSLIENQKQMDVLAEVKSGNYITGHTENFIECSIPADTVPCNIRREYRGKMLKIVPKFIDGDRLVCDLADNCK